MKYLLRQQRWLAPALSVATIGLGAGCGPTHSDRSAAVATVAPPQADSSSASFDSSAPSLDPTPESGTNANDSAELAPGMTWTLVPTGGSWQVTDQPTGISPTVAWSYSYTGSEGRGTMTVANGDVRGLQPFDAQPTPAMVDGRSGSQYLGAAITWVTLDGADDLVAVIETDSRAVAQAMVASLTVEQTERVETVETESSTVPVLEG